MNRLVATILLAATPLLGAASDTGVRFDTVVSEEGKPIATPSVWVEFGQEAMVEVPKKVRIVATAAVPTGDTSKVEASMYYFSKGAWVLDWHTSMDANIAETPSFEKDMGDHKHRVVVMPRKALKPESSGS